MYFIIKWQLMDLVVVYYFHQKNKEYGDTIFKNPDEDYIIKNINTLTKDECNKYLTDKYKLVSLYLGKFVQFQWLMKIH